MTTLTKDDDKYPEMDYFMDESISDVIFLIDGRRLPAIKQTLSLKSRVFRAMFSGNFKESQELQESKLTEIEVKDTTIDAFKTLVLFIYTEQLVFKDEKDYHHICHVFLLSDRFEVLRLRERVLNHFQTIPNLKDLLSITRVVSALNSEQLMETVVAFMKTNINSLVETDVEELRKLNELTDNKLLDVLTGDHLFENQITVYSKDRVFTIKRELLFHNLFETIDGFPVNEITEEYISFEAFKTFVGFLYFDKLVLNSAEDFQLIREVCELSKRYKQMKLLDSFIRSHLENTIRIENLESISGIAFDFKIDGLMKRVIDFSKQNYTKIVGKSDDILIKINDSTDNTLFKMFAEFIRNNRQ